MTNVDQWLNQAGEFVGLALTNCHLDILRTLVEVPELQLGRCNNSGVTALLWAFSNNNVSIMKLLCQDSRCSPGVVNKKGRYGDTALMWAVIRGYLDIVKELDREGTDFFTKDRDGTTLIEMARREDHVEVLKYLKQRPKVDSLNKITNIITR